MSRSPFASVLTNVANGRGGDSPSPSGIWTGRVAYAHRDSQNRLLFLFDIIPLGGWPAASEDIGGTATSGASALRGVTRVRMLQPFVGTLRDAAASPTGIIAVPSVGSVVSVAPDDSGWVIIGFHSGPVIAADGSISELQEVGFNPGFEEAHSSLNRNDRIPWLTGIDEGDVLLGNGDSRVKLNNIGVFIGNGRTSCLHVYKTQDSELLERYASFERRATGRLSYHKYLPGVAASFATAAITAPLPDAMVINTDIIESSPYLGENRPYVLQQRGFITEGTAELGRKAGEVLPLPNEVTTEAQTGKFGVYRDSVIQPTRAPDGTAADARELDTTSHVVFDKQIAADGSFHLRAGNIRLAPGASILGGAGLLDFELAYDAKTSKFGITLGRGGVPILSMTMDGLAGNMSLEAQNTITLKAKQVVIESDVATKINSNGAVRVDSQGPTTIDSPNLSLDQTGVLEAMADVIAAGLGLPVSLKKHTHMYTNVSTPSITAPPGP